MSDTPLEQVLRCFPKARLQNNGWYAVACPAHDDRHISFGFRECEDGHIHMKCHAGCSIRKVLAAVNLPMSALYPAHHNSRVSTRRKITPFTYLSAKGKVLFQAVRVEPGANGRRKDFFYRRPDGTGGWINNMNGTKRVLYCLPELLTAIAAGQVIYIAEGEVCVEALRRLGLTATTNPGGAGKWRPEYNSIFQDCDVVVCEDHDEGGKSHAQMILEGLQGIATRTTLLTFRDMPVHSDIADWLLQGHTVNDLHQRIEQQRCTQEQERQQTELVVGDQFRCTHIGNAERLVQQFGDRFRYCSSLNSFLVYDGMCWKPDEEFQVEALAHQVVRNIPKELGNTTDSSTYRAVLQHAIRSESDGAISAMLRRSRALPEVTVKATSYDMDPWLFNCKNGTLDLRTGELRPHSSADQLMKFVPVAYNPNSVCPEWLQFLEVVMQHNETLIGFLHRAIGYTLTGIGRERVFFILHGKGRNGKSCFLNTIRKITGSYAVRTPTQTLMLKRDHGIPNDVARLVGIRFVTASETENGKPLDEALIKDVTGGEPINARFLHHEWFEFDANFKVWLSTNHIPLIRGTDDAIWDRIRLVPFQQRFWIEGETPNAGELPADLLLQQRLYTESEGILAWAVQGCLLWQKEGLPFPTEVRRAVRKYRADMDSFQGFLESECVLLRTAWVSSMTLYTAYVDYCKAQEIIPESQRTIASRLRDLGMERLSTRSENRWLGLELKPLPELGDGAFQ